MLQKIGAYHLERPYPSYPHLEFAARHAFNVYQIDTLPPAAPSRLSPEEKKLLRHADRVGVGVAVAN